MRLAICSFALHRTFASGGMDLAGYAAFCREIGCATVDPWNAHLTDPADGADTVRAGRNPHDARLGVPSAAHIATVADVLRAGGLPVGCIAVDGAHVYDADPEKRRLHRERAHAWIDIARTLGAQSVRIDAGGPEDLPEDVLAIIAEGYADILSHARAAGLEVLIENHWGPSTIPTQLLRILEACPGLGLLFDTNNWKKDLQREGWERCARHARNTHVKTYRFDASGNPEGLDLDPAFAALRAAHYAGPWGIESVPPDGDELGAVRRTADLIRRKVAA